MKYFIVIKCEYPEGYLTSQGYSIHIEDKYYYQPVIKYNPITEEYSYGEGGIKISLKENPVYFNSLKEAKEVAKIIQLYEKTEDVLDKTLRHKTPRKDNDMISWEILVCSKNSLTSHL